MTFEDWFGEEQEQEEGSLGSRLDGMSDIDIEREKTKMQTLRLEQQVLAEARRNAQASKQVCLVEESKESLRKVLNPVINAISQLPDICFDLDGDKEHNREKLEEWVENKLGELRGFIAELK